MDDCARLENVFTREGNGGSNPFLSAEKVRIEGGPFVNCIVHETSALHKY